MTTSGSILNNENEHVQELKRLFLASNVDENKCLNRAGLKILLDKLKLTQFTEDITERVLCGLETVDFFKFKDRFVAFLPEIIDLTSNNVESLDSKSCTTALLLGFEENQKLTRYEVRLLCENTEELKKLSVIDINTLFDAADSDNAGKISLHQFLEQYRLQKRIREEVHFIAESFVSTLNLFEFMDPSNTTGHVESHELIDSWNKVGLRWDEGLSVIKNASQPANGPINLVYLSAFLERELSKYIIEAPVTVKAAILTLHLCIDHLRYSARDLEARAEHLHKQLQLANKRRLLLIDEMETNQSNLDQMYFDRHREIDERYRTKVAQLDEKYRIEKAELQSEIEQLEHEIHQRRQAEMGNANKINMLEQQINVLRDENREHQNTIMTLNRVHHELKASLNRVLQPKLMESTSYFQDWRRKTDTLLEHNKKLRQENEHLRYLLHKAEDKAIDPRVSKIQWTKEFKTHVLRLRNLNGTSASDRESAPEMIFQRRGRQKRRPWKEHMARRARVLSRMQPSHSGSDSGFYNASHPDDKIKRMERKVLQMKEALMEIKCEKKRAEQGFSLAERLDGRRAGDISAEEWEQIDMLMNSRKRKANAISSRRSLQIAPDIGLNQIDSVMSKISLTTPSVPKNVQLSADCEVCKSVEHALHDLFQFVNEINEISYYTYSQATTQEIRQENINLRGKLAAVRKKITDLRLLFPRNTVPYWKRCMNTLYGLVGPSSVPTATQEPLKKSSTPRSAIFSTDDKSPTN